MASVLEIGIAAADLAALATRLSNAADELLLRDLVLDRSEAPDDHTEEQGRVIEAEQHACAGQLQAASERIDTLSRWLRRLASDATEGTDDA